MSEDASLVKRALSEIRALRARLDAADSNARVPLAIVGMGLRLPGQARDAASFAELLSSGRDPIGDIPPSRWPINAFYSPDPDAPGKTTTRQGGFIDDVDQFDAEFFGISGREAASLDPQQRLLLELAWEAIENAGIAAGTLSGAKVGVYVGMANCDYGRAIFTQREKIDPYFATGTLLSVAAGRVAYTLGLTGPALTVDTACSASLVSMHLACQALRLGECDAALVGGVNLMLTPEVNISFTKGRMMSEGERCRSFDADADGYVRGEGGVIFLVKRLSDAEAQGDRVLAIVRGSAVNQDGRSSGLTAPNGPAQEAVIRAALANAGLRPNQVGYVEAHGTGTQLGDPIELGALSAVFAPERLAERPLLVGAVKSVIGHTEAAAGAAGIAKCVIAFANDQISPNLHFKRGNPHVDWEHGCLEVVTERTPFPADENGCRVAGVSSFGISGTNAHILLEAPSRRAEPQQRAQKASELERPAHLLAISAMSPIALDDIAARWRETFADEVLPADVCHTANAGRVHFNRRLAVIARTRDEFQAALSIPQLQIRGGSDGAIKPQVAFLYTGQGANFAGMGRGLYESSPTFRAALDGCSAAFAPHITRDLLDVMFAGDDAVLENTALAQPATFALQVALTTLWRSWGIEPMFAAGHSLGELAAAWAGGIFHLADAAAVVAARGRAAALVEGRGAMAAAYLTEAELADVLSAFEGLEIAVHNGPEHFVVSGPPEAVTGAVESITAAGRRAKLLKIPFGSHARTVEPALPAFAKALADIRFEDSQIGLASNVSGALAAPGEMSNAAYWIRQMRKPVRFMNALQALSAQGVTHFVEIGPHPSLCAVGEESLRDEQLSWLPSMRRDVDPWQDLLESLARLYVDGAEINWCGFDNDYARSRIAGPTYPFRRQRHWIDAAEVPDASATAAWSRAAAAASAQAKQGPLGLDPKAYPATWECLENLVIAQAGSILQQAGLFLRPERKSFDEICHGIGLADEYRGLLRRWLERLTASGQLQWDGAEYSSTAPLPAPDLEARIAEAKRLLADNPQLFEYVHHCLGLLTDVITGRESPLETLFPGGSFELAEALYERSMTMRYINTLAAATAGAFAGSVAAGRFFRVLEVGAGTGGTTSSVLPAMPAGRTSYCFTDVSDLFLDRGRERFAHMDGVRFERFDLNADLAAQGYEEASFDLILAANSVHACVDLPSALSRLRTLLTPGGALLLVESTVSFAWFDMTTHLIEGWRAADDDLRASGPLLQAETWLQALHSAGFERAEFWPKAKSDAEAMGQHVILAQVPGEFSEPTSTMLKDRVHAEQDVVAPVADRVEFVVDAILAAPETERLGVMREFVRAQVMAVLRVDKSPDRHGRLTDLGMDSLMAVQLRNRLAKGLSLIKPPAASVMFDHPTIEALSNHLVELLTPRGQLPSVSPTAASPRPFSADAVAAMDDKEIEALIAARTAGR